MGPTSMFFPNSLNGTVAESPKNVKYEVARTGNHEEPDDGDDARKNRLGGKMRGERVPRTRRVAGRIQ